MGHAPSRHPTRHLLKKRSRVIVPIDSAVLLAWAEELFAKGLTVRTRRTRCTTVRDAVIIGLLAERAPRLRALSMLRLGDSLKRSETVWLLREHAEMTKTKAPYDMPVSARVSRMLDRYVDVERREMLGDQDQTAAAWVWFGGGFNASGIVNAVKKRLLQRFGRSQGPHFFRHCLGTTLPDRLPQHPLDGSTMLGHAEAPRRRSSPTIMRAKWDARGACLRCSTSYGQGSSRREDTSESSSSPALLSCRACLSRCRSTTTRRLS